MLRRFSLIFSAVVALASLGLVGTAAAQDGTGGSLFGRVIDSETGESLESATVELRSAADSSLVSGTAANSEGIFRINGIAPGDYYVRVGFVGFAAEIISDVQVSGGTELDMGEISLMPDTAELEEVAVSAEREYIEVGIDRTTYNTQDQPVNLGGSATDVLENIPSVEVDIDGNISLRGSQGVSVYLNGKPAPMSGEALTSFLQGLAAGDIERVEVIPNPSARYEPEGTSGILNIELVKKEGLGWGGGASTSMSTRGRYGGSVNAHFGNGPWNVYGNYSLRYSSWDRSGWRFRENRYLDPLTFLEQDMASEEGGFSNNVNATFDYTPNDRNSLSFTAIFSRRTEDGEEFNSYTELDAGRDLTERYTRDSDTDETDFSMDYRLDYSHTIVPREHELTVEARYEDDRQTELERFVQRVLPLEESDSDSNGRISEQQHVDESESERELSFDADYVRPLTEQLRAELGIESDFEWVDNGFYSESENVNGIFTPDTDLNNTFLYSEQQHSAFAVLAGNLGRFGAQLGLRLEQALTDFNLRTTGETFTNSYLSIFPSVHASYEIAQGNTVKAAYSKRVRRPNEWQLNPFGDYDDPTSRRMGNPYLTPEYTHSAELSYTRLGEKYTLTASPYLRYTVDEISWHERITEEGVTILTFENFDTEQSYGAELIGSLSLGQWLKSELSMNFYKQVTEAGNLASELSSDALGFRSRLSGTAEIMPGLKLQLSQRYRSPMDIPGGRISARTRTDLALRQEWLSGRLSVGMRVQDIFDGTQNLIQRDMERYYQEYYRDWNRRNVRFSVRYSFNSRSEDNETRGGGWRGRR